MTACLLFFGLPVPFDCGPAISILLFLTVAVVLFTFLARRRRPSLSSHHTIVCGIDLGSISLLFGSLVCLFFCWQHIGLSFRSDLLFFHSAALLSLAADGFPAAPTRAFNWFILLRARFISLLIMGHSHFSKFALHFAAYCLQSLLPFFDCASPFQF